MTLKQLAALYWAGTLGSFALAAERLYTTQSSLSKRILDLEEEVGAKLFDRSGSKARLTESGARVMKYAEQMLNLRDAILVSVHGDHGLRGTCRFGISELAASTWLAELVGSVRQALPEVLLEPKVAVAQELLLDVQKGETDFAIGPVSSIDASVVSQHLIDVPMVWVCSPGLLPADAVLTPELLEQHPLISMSKSSAVATAIEKWAVTNGIKFKKMVASNNASAVTAVTAAGIGIALIAAPLVQSHIDQGKLRQLPIDDRLYAPTLGYYLSWRESDQGAVSTAVRKLALQLPSLARPA